MTNSRPVTTTDAGVAAPSDEYSQSAGPKGPLLLQDHYLIQKMAQFNGSRSRSAWWSARRCHPWPIWIALMIISSTETTR